MTQDRGDNCAKGNELETALRQAEARIHALEAEVEDLRQRLQETGPIGGAANISGPGIVLMLNANCKVTMINEQACQLLGYEREEVLGKHWIATFIPPQLKDEITSVWDMVISGQHRMVEFFENPILTRDKRQPIIAWHNAIMRGKNDEVVGILSTGRLVSMGDV